ncbi:MAG: hypothetical protein ACFFB0_03580 [Promethearchaeota archaeon]
MLRRKKKERIPSDYFCVICGRYTNDKRYSGDNWINQFFVCHTCKKVWCGSCMGQVTGQGPRKTYNLGKKGKVSCPDCGNFAAMIRLPENLPFKQIKPQEIASINAEQITGKNYCKFCGEVIPESASYCNACGAKQD